jgi:hypothetical protein
MANTITPNNTNIATSGRTLNLSTEVEYNAGEAVTTNKAALIKLVTAAMPYKQCIDIVIDVPATATDFNLWEATDIDTRAVGVVVVCEYGGGGVTINPDGAPIPFPISADSNAGNGYIIYCNPSGLGLTVGAVQTGRGINKVAVSTEVESRFNVYVFI